MHLSFQLNSKSKYDFLQHWSSKYDDSNEDEYSPHIGRPLTNLSLQALFRWKNGSKISNRKLKSINDNYPLVFEGSHVERYLNHRQPGGAIWNIFYLHCLNHLRWPIFDQHTFRAMRYLKTGEFHKIGDTDKRKYAEYQFEYIPFLRQFDHVNPRDIDKALYSFGQFLKLAQRYA